MSLYFDPKILKALKLAGEQMMKEYKERKMSPPPFSFATGGYVSYEHPPFGGEINWDVDYDPEHLNPEGTVIIDMKENHNIPFYHECYNFKPDLTTSQKMKVFKFIIALETAEEI